MKVLLVFCVILLVGSSFEKYTEPSKDLRKQRQGPPEQFKFYNQPSPEAGGVETDYAWQPITLKASRSGDSYSWEGQFPVDSDERFILTVFKPKGKTVCVYAAPAGHKLVELTEDLFNQPASNGMLTTHTFGIGLEIMPATTYSFFDPQPGLWSFKFVSKEQLQPKAGLPDLYLILGNESPTRVFCHLNTYDLQVGQSVGLVVRAFDANSVDPEAKAAPQALTETILKAEMEVILPDGNEVTVEMKDDGESGDLEANDGVYAASIEVKEPGNYVAQSLVKGVDENGRAFYRTSEHLFKVVEPAATLTGLASAAYNKDKSTVNFFIDVDVLNPEQYETNGMKLRAYAQVWGTDHSGTGLDYVPVGWVMAMVDPQPHGTNNDGSTRYVVEMQMHQNWFTIAGAKTPLQLREVQLADPGTSNPLSERKKVFVQFENSKDMNLDYFTKITEITQDMKMGPRPPQFPRYAPPSPPQLDNTVTQTGKVLLVHGYCAGSVEFTRSDFTDWAEYNDFAQSRTNDQFALRIAETGNKFPSFSTVAHSQGGTASLHLHAFYWSALDAHEKPGLRKIQSVGTPYQGTNLAGNLADLGGVFGLGCGGNTDLTRDGAVNWLSKIPLDARKDVWYYTTQYEDSWWLSAACVTGANFVLATPNDGTTAKKYGQLEGGNNAGHKKGWCHTGGMSYGAQCTDPKRNAEMNKEAAR